MEFIYKKNDFLDHVRISRFTAGGSGWAEADMGSPPTPQTLALDSVSPKKLYATTTIGIYANYGGIEWTKIMDKDGGRGIGEWVGFIAMAMDPTSPGKFWFANTGGLSRCAFVPLEKLPGFNMDAFKRYSTIPISEDFWKEEKTWPVLVDVGGIAVAPTSPPTVYAATSCCGVLKNTVGTGD